MRQPSHLQSVITMRKKGRGERRRAATSSSSLFLLLFQRRFSPLFLGSFCIGIRRESVSLPKKCEDLNILSFLSAFLFHEKCLPQIKGERRRKERRFTSKARMCKRRKKCERRRNNQQVFKCKYGEFVLCLHI